MAILRKWLTVTVKSICLPQDGPALALLKVLLMEYCQCRLTKYKEYCVVICYAWIENVWTEVRDVNNSVIKQTLLTT
jgi:hypothetical protein